jgi:DNA-binding MltR family transcriptional regulator
MKVKNYYAKAWVVGPEALNSLDNLSEALRAVFLYGSTKKTAYASNEKIRDLRTMLLKNLPDKKTKDGAYQITSDYLETPFGELRLVATSPIDTDNILVLNS